MSRGLANRARGVRALTLFLTLSGAMFALACRRHEVAPVPAPPALASATEPALPSSAGSPVALVDARDRFEIIPNLSWCEVEHEGLLLDLGSPGAAAYRGFGAERAEDTEDVERDGQTFVRAYARSLRYDFWLDEPRSGTTLSLRVYGGAAKSLGVAIDDKRVGSAKLSPGETKILSLPALGAELGRGIIG